MPTNQIIKARIFTANKLARDATAKEARGGFDQRVYISRFEMATDNESVEYYLSQPHKYPEQTV